MKKVEYQSQFAEIIDDQEEQYALTKEQHLNGSNYKKFRDYVEVHGSEVIESNNSAILIFILSNLLVFAAQVFFIFVLNFKLGYFLLLVIGLLWIKFFERKNKSKKEYDEQYTGVKFSNPKSAFKSLNAERVAIVEDEWMCPFCKTKNLGKECCKTCGVLSNLVYLQEQERK